MEAGSRVPEFGQAYALRAWAAWLQTQISKAQPDLERKIDEHQREIARLRGAIQRSGSVLKSLRTTIEQLDETLRDVHDTEIVEAGMRVIASAQQQPAPAASPAHGDRGLLHDHARARN